MDKGWDRKSFKVGGHWPLWRTTDKSRTLKKTKKLFGSEIWWSHYQVVVEAEI